MTGWSVTRVGASPFGNAILAANFVAGMRISAQRRFRNSGPVGNPNGTLAPERSTKTEEMLITSCAEPCESSSGLSTLRFD